MRVKICGLVILVMGLFVSFARGQSQLFDVTALSEHGRSAYQSLLKERQFAIGGVGYGGITSEGEKAFDVLSEEKQSVLAFKSLVNDATLAGGLYGLFGLKLADCDCFDTEYKRYLHKSLSPDNKETLRTASGCEITIAETNDDKKLVITFIVEKGFESLKQKKMREREYKKSQMPSDNDNKNGVKKSI